MPIPLGILAAAGFRPLAAGDFVLLESTTLTTNTASVTFSSLGSYASTYQHLQIRTIARTNRSGAVNDNIQIRFNADSGSNYAWHQLAGTGSSVVSGAQTSQTYALGGITAGNSATSSAFYPSVTDLLDAFESSKNTTIRTLTGLNESDREIGLRSAFWNNTASLTSIELRSLNAASFVTGSRFSLYGLRS